MTQCIDIKQVTKFEQYLREEEKSQATTEKYIRDVHYFLQFLSEMKITGIAIKGLTHRTVLVMN